MLLKICTLIQIISLAHLFILMPAQQWNRRVFAELLKMRDTNDYSRLDELTNQREPWYVNYCNWLSRVPMDKIVGRAKKVRDYLSHPFSRA
jgi:hypothetical protein